MSVSELNPMPIPHVAEIGGVAVKVNEIKEKKTRVRKVKEIPDSPFKIEENCEYYGSNPILVKWKDWILMCSVIKNSETFKKIYAREVFKYGDLEETAYVVHPVYTKEPQEVKNLDGKVIEVIPGIYDEENTFVLPPKFTFAIYRRYFISHPDLSKYLDAAQPIITKFEGYDFEMKFGPRGEQLELAEMAGTALKQQKYFKGIVQAAPGWGKATVNSTIMRTKLGRKTMGEIVVGDEVFGRHGRPIKVTGVFPQGSIKVWEVKFDDNTTTYCNGEHLWNIYKEIIIDEEPDYLTLKTKEIKNLIDNNIKCSIPLCDCLPEEYLRIIKEEDGEVEYLRAQGKHVTKLNENSTFKRGGLEYNIINGHITKPNATTKRIVSIIETDRYEDQTCIMVDDPEHLYLTENFTVTHNTYISINIGSQTNGQVLVVVPNNLLAGQWKKSILEFTNLTEDDIGLISGSDLDKLKRKGLNKKPFNIILIQSLDSQLQRANFEEVVDFYKNTSIVFYDETHTSGAADGYAKTTGIFTTYNIIGLSATPYKKDKNLFQLYTGIGQIVYISTHQNLIPNCNMHLLDVPISQKDLKELVDIFQKTNYNFFMSKLEDYLFKVDAYFVYIAEWLIYRYKQGYSTVVLFKTNKMLDKLQLFLDKLKDDLDIKSTILTNETAKKNRKELDTSNVILSNYKMFSAGADYPFLSCIFFASMILGKTSIIQSLGRVTRKHDTKIQEVQAHFLLPKFIYPLYSNNEPHLTIVRGVKVQYPEAQFKWDNGFTKYFEERKSASQDLNSNKYVAFQNNQGQLPAQTQKGDFLVDGQYSDSNRLEVYRRQQMQAQVPVDQNGMPIRPQGFIQ